MIIFQVSRLARAIGVHRNTVTNWIRSGKLPALAATARKYRISAEAFEAFCRAEKIPETVVQGLVPGERTRRIEKKALTHNEQFISREVSMTEKPTGSVMVVGGGIAGIQATLDLADSGYYVYLVEKSAGIGGAMAQLDKTFPTNDCAM